MVRFAVGLTAAFVAACGSLDADSTESPVVGGRTETRYPFVGYLMVGETPESLAGPHCGATLIHPRVAVTAAHCIVMAGTPSFGMGFGKAGSGPAHPASRVLVHPGYSAQNSPRFIHDVAVLILDKAASVKPASIARAVKNSTVRYVGYGRVTPGDSTRTDGYTGERKSARELITALDALDIDVTGVDGGLCWGDSGGPIVSSGKVYGVLADFDQVFDCEVGNKMIFTSLDAERAFIDAAASCVDPNAAACPAAKPLPASCDYTCAAYHYTEGQCSQNWKCVSGCLVQTACK